MEKAIFIWILQKSCERLFKTPKTPVHTKNPAPGWNTAAGVHRNQLGERHLEAAKLVRRTSVSEVWNTGKRDNLAQ